MNIVLPVQKLKIDFPYTVFDVTNRSVISEHKIKK